MNINDTFTLMGRTGPVFVAVELYNAAGFIPSVVGHTADGKLRTVARVVDVVPVPALPCAWHEPETLERGVSHGICAACTAKFFPETL